MLCRKTAALMKIDYYPASQLSDTNLTYKGIDSISEVKRHLTLYFNA